MFQAGAKRAAPIRTAMDDVVEVQSPPCFKKYSFLSWHPAPPARLQQALPTAPCFAGAASREEAAAWETRAALSWQPPLVTTEKQGTAWRAAFTQDHAAGAAMRVTTLWRTRRSGTGTGTGISWGTTAPGTRCSGATSK